MVNWPVMFITPLTITSLAGQASNANAGIVPRTPVFFGKRQERPGFLI
jgi:hypothetical protein